MSAYFFVTLYGTETCWQKRVRVLLAACWQHRRPDQETVLYQHLLLSDYHFVSPSGDDTLKATGREACDQLLVGVRQGHCGKEGITVIPPHPRSCFLWFQFPTVSGSLNILNGKFQNKQHTRFKLGSVLSSVIKSCTIQRCPTWAVNHPFVQRLHAADPATSPLC